MFVLFGHVHFTGTIYEQVDTHSYTGDDEIENDASAATADNDDEVVDDATDVHPSFLIPNPHPSSPIPDR